MHSESVYRKRTQHNGQQKKVHKDKQRSTKHTYKTKDRVRRTPLKSGCELSGNMCLLTCLLLLKNVVVLLHTNQGSFLVTLQLTNFYVSQANSEKLETKEKTYA